MLDPHLTKPQGEDLARMQLATVPGMAFWAGSGPAGKTCRECTHWCPAGEKLSRHAKHGEAVRHFGKIAGTIKDDRRCAMYPRLAQGRDGDPIPYGISACRYFQPSDAPPPERMRWAGPKCWQPLEEPPCSA